MIYVQPSQTNKTNSQFTTNVHPYPYPPPFLLSFKLYNCLFFANINVNSNNLVQKLQALRVNVGKKICCFFQNEWMLLIYRWEKYWKCELKKKKKSNYELLICDFKYEKSNIVWKVPTSCQMVDPANFYKRLPYSVKISILYKQTNEPKNRV